MARSGACVVVEIASGFYRLRDSCNRLPPRLPGAFFPDYRSLGKREYHDDHPGLSDLRDLLAGFLFRIILRQEESFAF